VEELIIQTINKLIKIEEASKELSLEKDTIRKYINRGKIRSIKDEKGRHMITKKEVERYKNEKIFIEEETRDYFSIKQLEMLGIPKEIVIGGEIESKTVKEKYYVHYKEAKRYLKAKACPRLRSTECKETLKVINRGGLHFRPSAKIIEIGNNYLNKGIALEIFHKEQSWLFPSMGILELLSLEVHRGESIIVQVKGPGAMLCMGDIAKAFKENFDVEY